MSNVYNPYVGREKGSFPGAHGPIDAYRNRSGDETTSEEETDQEDKDENKSADAVTVSSSSSSSSSSSEDEEAFVVDDDVIDGMRVTPPGGSGAIVEHAKAELPGSCSEAVKRKMERRTLMLY